MASGTVAITTAINETQKEQVTNLLVDTVSAIASVVYTFISTIVQFFLRPDVLGVVVVLMIAGMVFRVLWKRFGRRTL